MKIEYTIPEILNIAAIRGYSPKLASSVNTMLNTDSQIEYDEALKTATQEITGYDIVEVGDVQKISGYNELELFEDDDTIMASSHFGLPIYHPLLLEQVDGTSGDLLLESAVIDISRAKRVVTTELQGVDNSVKEFITNGDYQIKVSGLLVTNGASYPKEELGKLNAFMEAKTPIGVVHEVLDKINVRYVVVTSYSYPRAPFSNAQPYEFSCVSDQPIIINI